MQTTTPTEENNTDQQEQSRTRSLLDLLPEFEIAGGIKVRIHEHFGRWFVSTRGDVVLFRMRAIIEGKVEKERPVSQYVITYDQLTARNWVAEVWKHLRGVNMTDFMQAFTCALELTDKEMDAMTYKPL